MVLEVLLPRLIRVRLSLLTGLAAAARVLRTHPLDEYPKPMLKANLHFKGVLAGGIFGDVLRFATCISDLKR